VEEGIIERLVKRLENVPLINKEANEIAWKRHKIMPLLVDEIADMLSQILSDNYVVIMPSLIIADVEYRSWHSKTYCKDADCLAEQRQYNELVEILQRLSKPSKEVVVPEWKHYCGASPVYHRYNIVILRKPVYYALVAYNGGRCWHAEYYHIVGVGIEHKSEFLTDGCVDWEMFVNPPKPQP